MRKSNLLSLKCSTLFIAILLLMAPSCRKAPSPDKPLNFMINVHNYLDTVLVFNDTETYRISNVITGEGRCPNINCSGCQVSGITLQGSCTEEVYIHNKAGDSITLNMEADGCRIDESGIALSMLDIQQFYPHFHFHIGLFKITPYPDMSNYTNPDSITNFNNYVTTYIITKP